jgi:hypothetical protein
MEGRRDWKKSQDASKYREENYKKLTKSNPMLEENYTNIVHKLPTEIKEITRIR